MVACPGGHMFCSECVTRQAETKLGEQQVVSGADDRRD